MSESNPFGDGLRELLAFVGAARDTQVRLSGKLLPPTHVHDESELNDTLRYELTHNGAADGLISIRHALEMNWSCCASNADVSDSVVDELLALLDLLIGSDYGLANRTRFWNQVALCESLEWSLVRRLARIVRETLGMQDGIEQPDLETILLLYGAD